MDDLISRQQAIDALEKIDCSDGVGLSALKCDAVDDAVVTIKALPSAQPYTDAEIQKMQDLEQAQFDKMYQLGYEEGKQAAQPQRMKGRWVRKESDLSWWYECSECGESPLFDPYENEVLTPFCPWCGSDMRGDEDAAD